MRSPARKQLIHRPQLTLLWLVVCVLVAIAGLEIKSAAAQSGERLRIEGQVVQGTSNAQPLPQNLPVELIIATETTGVVERFGVTTDADGSFVFENIPRLDEDHIYTIVCEYAGLPQISQPVTAENLDEFIELPLYETTETINPEQVRILEGNMVIDFVDSTQVGLQILLEFSLLNVGDRIINSENGVFAFELPVGAYGIGADVAAEETGRYQVDSENTIPIVLDTLPIVPGRPHQIQLSYFLPYNAGAIIHQVFPVAVTNFSIWVPDQSLQVTSDLFAKGEDVEGESGQTYQIYQQKNVLERDAQGNANLIFTVEGIPVVTSPASSARDAQDDDGYGLLWLIPLILTGLVGLIAVVWLVGRGTITLPNLLTKDNDTSE